MVKDVITEISNALVFTIHCLQKFYGQKISKKVVKLNPYDLRIHPTRASRPPKKWNLLEELVEDVNRWY